MEGVVPRLVPATACRGRPSSATVGRLPALPPRSLRGPAGVRAVTPRPRGRRQDSFDGLGCRVGGGLDRADPGAQGGVGDVGFVEGPVNVGGGAPQGAIARGSTDVRRRARTPMHGCWGSARRGEPASTLALARRRQQQLDHWRSWRTWSGVDPARWCWGVGVCRPSRRRAWPRRIPTSRSARPFSIGTA